MNEIKYNSETRSFGFWSNLGKVLGELARTKHLVVVLADPTNHVVFELHQNGSIGLRLADQVQQLEDKMGLKFVIKKKFILDTNYPQQVEEYKKFRQQMFDWFA